MSLFDPQAGDMVAALYRGGDGEENWILAEVISYNPSTGKYEVEDIDEEQRERMVLSRRRVIPLPTRRANPDTQPEALFHEGDVGGCWGEGRGWREGGREECSGSMGGEGWEHGWKGRDEYG